MDGRIIQNHGKNNGPQIWKCWRFCHNDKNRIYHNHGNNNNNKIEKISICRKEKADDVETTKTNRNAYEIDYVITKKEWE